MKSDSSDDSSRKSSDRLTLLRGRNGQQRDGETAGSSRQPVSPSSRSPPLRPATPRPTQALPESVPSTSGLSEHMTLVAYAARYLWHLLRQHETGDAINPGLLSIWASRYGNLSERVNGCINRVAQRRNSSPISSSSGNMFPGPVPQSSEESVDFDIDTDGSVPELSSDEQNDQSQADLESSIYAIDISEKESTDEEN